MILYWEGKPFPIIVRPADVLYIAGNISVPQTRKLPFEHVARVAEPREIRSAEEFLGVPVFALPESSPKRNDGYMAKVTGLWWRKHIDEPEIIGSVLTVWNLGARNDLIGANRAEDIGAMLALLSDSKTPKRLRFSYHPVFAVSESLTENIHTNCLGFVCSVYDSLNYRVLDYNFPEYPSPFDTPPETRNFPSPGHLARALSLPVGRYPYVPKDTTEAEVYSRASTVLREQAKTATS